MSRFGVETIDRRILVDSVTGTSADAFKNDTGDLSTWYNPEKARGTVLCRGCIKSRIYPMAEEWSHGTPGEPAKVVHLTLLWSRLQAGFEFTGTGTPGPPVYLDLQHCQSSPVTSTSPCDNVHQQHISQPGGVDALLQGFLGGRRV